MKLQHILVIPIAFVSGIVCIVLLERGGLVQVSSAGSEAPAVTSGSSSEQQNTGSKAVAAQSNADNLASSGTTIANNDIALSNELLIERIDLLQQQLRSATVNADMMQSRIKSLEQTVQALPVGTEFLPDGGGSPGLSGEALVQQDNNAGNQPNQWSGFGEPDNDVQYTSLVSAGVDPLVAEQIKQRSDEWTLQRLELIDQATREGWRRSDQFRDRLSDLREERPNLRDELGDAEYDRYLYVSGEFNRVQISNIINGSAAQTAGMENGDVVLSYANRRVFTSRELQQATRAGSRGESVLLQVLRNGEQITVELPRGPMGVSLTGKRVEPAAF